MAVSFKGAHFPKEIILMGVRWYVAYPLSTRHVEELMEERGVEVDHTVSKWELSIECALCCCDRVHEVRKARQRLQRSWRVVLDDGAHGI
jgi:putative transposase